MILERTEHPDWVSNAYLVADRPGGHGVFIDGNDVPGPLIEQARAQDVTIDAILVTHAHADHVAGIDQYRAAFPDAQLIAHAKAEVEGTDRTADEGDELRFGDLTIQPLYTPGHTVGHLAYLVNGTDCFTADVLFKGTVGGTFAPGATGYADLKASVERLVDLPAETRLHPGHTLPTTAGDEREHNPFVRIWRGVDAEGDERCTVWGREATLVLWAPDYDGTNKAWIRFADDGADGIVGGSQVER